MITVYLKIPAELHIKYQTRVVSSKAFKIDRDLRGNAFQATLLPGNPVTLPGQAQIPDFVISMLEDVFDQDSNKIGTTEERYPEFVLQGKDIATLEDGSKIVHALIPFNLNEMVKIYLLAQEPDAEELDALTVYNLNLLGIDQIIGYTEADVFAAYPELVGQEVVGQDEEGNDVYMDIMMKHRWSGQD